MTDLNKCKIKPPKEQPEHPLHQQWPDPPTPTPTPTPTPSLDILTGINVKVVNVFVVSPSASLTPEAPSSPPAITAPPTTPEPPPSAITGQVVFGTRGVYTFHLPADGNRDWALIRRDRRPDIIASIGEEDRIGVLGAKRVRLSGTEGRIKIRDHRRRLVGVIRDHDISLAEAQAMTFALPQGWIF
tara:strand:+ start:407 stop:964 length:558 start_codon:yes stop_codon:yes gene_type:complete